MSKIYCLDNGVTVILEEMPFIRSIAFGVWVKNGSRNEDKNVNGISHFIEHMLFKGTQKRTAKMIADEMDAVGGQLNAYTTKELTCYYTRTLDTHFDTALDILSDMVLNSKFENAEIAKELNVILEEINMYEDSPEESVHDILEYNVFNGASLGFPVLGEKESIETFNTDILKNYYNSNYHQDNMVIAAAGNFNSAEILEKINKALGGFKRTVKYLPTEFVTGFNKAVVTKAKDIEQVHISIGFPGIKLGDDDSYALSAFNTIFGGGMSSRLFQTIREEHGLSYSVYSYNASYVDCGIFSVYTALNVNQTDEVLRLIFSEIKRLNSERITEEQLIKTKEQLKSNYIMSLENSANRMSSLGRAQILIGKILTPEETIEKIDAVTIEDICRVASKIFNSGKMSVSAVGNTAGLNLGNYFPG
ncbi:MAG: insulinase family protein [Clostridiales bacterium]|jgi:predicted Zn-dependent peptidase|nr:insulinase family protein [Clostridiales bacterium]